MGEGFIVELVYKTRMKESIEIGNWINQDKVQVKVEKKWERVAPGGRNLYLLHSSEFGDLEAVEGSE